MESLYCRDESGAYPQRPLVWHSTSGLALAKAGPGCIFRRFYELRIEVAQFFRTKGQPMAEMEDESWLCDLAFMVDITKHLNVLKKNCGGRDSMVMKYGGKKNPFRIR